MYIPVDPVAESGLYRCSLFGLFVQYPKTATCLLTKKFQ